MIIDTYTPIRRVAFLGRSGLFSDSGGDTIQLLATKEALEKLSDLDIKIFCSAKELIRAGKDEPFDIVHVFGILFISEFSSQVSAIRGVAKYLVVSPIYVDYSEFEAKDRIGPLFLVLSRIFGAGWLEYTKVIVKFLLGSGSLDLKYVRLGHAGAIKELLSVSNLLLPNSRSEEQRVRSHFNYSGPSSTVTNGVDDSIFDLATVTENPEWMKTVVCVGRIEGRKNQLRLIQACNELNVKLFIVGAPAKNQMRYYDKCRSASGKNVRFVGRLPQKEIATLFRSCEVAVLPSWFETTGLVSLEAAFMGAAIVITDRGDTAEYFGNSAIYCDPGSVDSIKDAVSEALAIGRATSAPILLRDRTWNNAALQTWKGYQSLR